MLVRKLRREETLVLSDAAGNTLARLKVRRVRSGECVELCIDAPPYFVGVIKEADSPFRTDLREHDVVRLDGIVSRRFPILQTAGVCKPEPTGKDATCASTK